MDPIQFDCFIPEGGFNQNMREVQDKLKLFRKGINTEIQRLFLATTTRIPEDSEQSCIDAIYQSLDYVIQSNTINGVQVVRCVQLHRYQVPGNGTAYRVQIVPGTHTAYRYRVPRTGYPVPRTRYLVPCTGNG